MAACLWKYHPILELRPNIAGLGAFALPNPTQVIGGSGPFLPAGTYRYYLVAAFDGAGRLRRRSFSQTEILGAPRTVAIAWNPVAGATHYMILREAVAGPLVGDPIRILYSGDGTDQGFLTRDGGNPAVEAPEDFALNTSGTTTAIDLRAGEFAAGRAIVQSVLYRDEAQVESDESINRVLAVREFGARRRVRMRFQVAAGSAEEADLLAVYSAKFAFPKGSDPGVRIWLSLNGGAAFPSFREVRIVGDFPRQPFNGRNSLVAFEWEFVDRSVRPTVPALFDTEGLGFT